MLRCYSLKILDDVDMWDKLPVENSMMPLIPTTTGSVRLFRSCVVVLLLCDLMIVLCGTYEQAQIPVTVLLTCFHRLFRLISHFFISVQLSVNMVPSSFPGIFLRVWKDAGVRSAGYPEHKLKSGSI